jgi:hypothetical protein
MARAPTDRHALSITCTARARRRSSTAPQAPSRR